MNITADQEKKLMKYLLEELETAIKDVVEPRAARFESFNDCYYGVTKPRRADWMSNVPMLMSATFVDAIKARLMGTVTQFKPMFMLEPTRNSGWLKVVNKTSQFLDYKVQREMHLPRVLRKVLFEACRLGTGAMLTPWRTSVKRKTVQRYFWKRDIEVPVMQGIIPEYLPMRDLVYPAGFSEVEALPWFARPLRWTKLMMRKAKAEGVYDHVDEVMQHEKPVDQQLTDAASRTEETIGPRIQGWEFYFEWDFKGDGHAKRYVAVVNFDINRVLRIEPLAYSEYPLRLLRYGPRDYGLEGLGVIETTRPLDDALYALYNLLIDNYKIATMQCLKGVKGSGLTADTSVYPGKLFLLDSLDDLEAFSLGQPYSMNPQFTQELWNLGERRSGVSDYALGRQSPGVGRGATATGTLALIQEGQRRFDETVADVRDTLDDFALFTLDEMHSRLDSTQAYMLLGEDGRYVEEFLNLPKQMPSMGLNVVPTAARASLNKETRKQDALATFQILERYYNTVQNLMLLVAEAPPDMREVLLGIAKGTADKVKQVLEAHGEIAPDEYVDLLAKEEEDERGAPEGFQAEPGMEGPPPATPGEARGTPGEAPEEGPTGEFRD